MLECSDHGKSQSVLVTLASDTRHKLGGKRDLEVVGHQKTIELLDYGFFL